MPLTASLKFHELLDPTVGPPQRLCRSHRRKCGRIEPLLAQTYAMQAGFMVASLRQSDLPLERSSPRVEFHHRGALSVHPLGDAAPVVA